MKVVILAGGYGTRLSEYTERMPKPMVNIGSKPILLHIMERYALYGHKDFYIALGYKAEVIKEYFLKFNTLNSDFSIDFSTGKVITQNKKALDWKVTLVETGQKSMTGGRIRRLKPYIGEEAFMLTYGDGLADINLDSLLKFHKSHGKMATISAVRPSARFGELKIENTKVTEFEEKPQINKGWINGGFFIFEPEFIDLINSDDTILEKFPLEKAAKLGELMAYNHKGSWQCMDTKRDRDHLEKLLKKGKAFWQL